jgi:hypothetical protein
VLARARGASPGSIERRGSSDRLGSPPSSSPGNVLGPGADPVDAQDGGSPLRLG